MLACFPLLLVKKLIIYLLHSYSILLSGLPVGSHSISNPSLLIAARMILKLPSHVTPLLKTSLEWLPVTFLCHCIGSTSRPGSYLIAHVHIAKSPQAPCCLQIPDDVLFSYLHPRPFCAWTTLPFVFTWMIISNPSCLSPDVPSLGNAFLGPIR